MSDNLPGFSAKDQAKPPTRRELAAQEKDFKALVTWYATGDEGKVRDALKLPSKAAARVAINRAVDAWHEEQSSHIKRVRTLHDSLLSRGTLALAEKVFKDDGAELHRFKELLAIMERHTKLLGIDAANEVEAGGNTYIIQAGGDISLVPPGGTALDVRAPWERDVIDGEAEDAA